MSTKINLPFTNKNSGGNKNIFTLFDDKKRNSNYKITTISFLKMFESMLKKKNNNSITKSNIRHTNNNSINIYNKGSETKKYYKQLKIK